MLFDRDSSAAAKSGRPSDVRTTTSAAMSDRYADIYMSPFYDKNKRVGDQDARTQEIYRMQERVQGVKFLDRLGEPAHNQTLALFQARPLPSRPGRELDGVVAN